MILSDEILGRKPASWWRFLGANIFAVLTYALIAFVLAALFATFSRFVLGEAALGLTIQSLSNELSIVGIFVFFGLIALMHPALALTLRVFYKRRYLSLVNPLRRPWRKDALYGAFLILATLLISEFAVRILPNWQSSVAFVWDVKLWLIWLLPVALVVFLQSSAEELVFRGFMQQYLARLTRRKWVYFVVPSLIWSLLHFANYDDPIVSSGFLITVFVMGLVFADWANLKGSLAGPLAAHFVNNFFAVCVIGNTEEASVMDIVIVDISQNSSLMKFVYLMIFTFALMVVYYFMRPRIAAEIAAEDELEEPGY